MSAVVVIEHGIKGQISSFMSTQHQYSSNCALRPVRTSRDHKTGLYFAGLLALKPYCTSPEQRLVTQLHSSKGAGAVCTTSTRAYKSE